jgi:hypothetical protein
MRLVGSGDVRANDWLAGNQFMVIEGHEGQHKMPGSGAPAWDGLLLGWAKPRGLLETLRFGLVSHPQICIATDLERQPGLSARGVFQEGGRARREAKLIRLSWREHAQRVGLA